MKLFTVGPVEMYPETLEVASQQLPYFRDQAFSDVMIQMEKELKELVHCEKGKGIFLTASGSGAMESIIACSLDQNDRVLVVNGGSFGDRFVRLCQCYHIPYDEIKLPFPQVLNQTVFDKIDGSNYTALLVNLHETSTGQYYDMELLSNFVKKYDLYFIVDAISTFLSDPYHMDLYGIDVTILSSQKALACAPGISMLVIQDSFYHEMIEPKKDTCMYLSIKEHVKNMKRGQTPNTPAVGVLLEMAQRMHSIYLKGSEQMIQATKEKALYFRNKVSSLPIQLPNYSFSNALTPLYFEQGNAKEVYQYLKEHYGIYLTPSGGALETKLLRVGHLGNVTLKDYDDLINRLKEVCE